MPTVITQHYDKSLSVVVKQASMRTPFTDKNKFTPISSVIKYHVYSRSLYQTPNK